jgi:replication factor A1
MPDSMLSVDQIIEEISKKTDMDAAKIRTMIEEKQEELSGLVSEEGAAYIIARENGVNLLKESKHQLKIKNLVSGLKSVDVVAKIVGISEIRTFEKSGKEGKVVNLTLADDTGICRISLWNDETNLVTEGKIREDDVIKISRGFVITDNRGNLEIRIGRGSLEKVEEDIDVVKMPEKGELQKFVTAQKTDISDVKEGGYYEVKASLVQVFRRNMFYEVCPVCNSRLNEGKCNEHGPVTPQFNVVISGVIDDGTENIRVVFFRDVAEKVFGKTVTELRNLSMKESNPMDVYDYFDNLGKDFIFRGRVKRNQFTENVEMVVNEMEEVDVRKEIENLLARQ